jgi:hypothetical protein
VSRVSGRYHVVGLHSLLVASGPPYLFICYLLFLSRIVDYHGYLLTILESGDRRTRHANSVPSLASECSRPVFRYTRREMGTDAIARLNHSIYLSSVASYFTVSAILPAWNGTMD